MQMIDKVNCAPYGYNPISEQPVDIPDAEPDEEEDENDEKEMLMGEMFRAVRTRDELDYLMKFDQWAYFIVGVDPARGA